MSLRPVEGLDAGDLPAGQSWLRPFEPCGLLRNGHLQTIFGNFWRRPRLELVAAPKRIVVDPADSSSVLCHCHWQPGDFRSRLSLLLVHGLEGSSGSGYIRGITALAWRAGCNVIRMNMRNCGGTESWSPTLYHSGLSGDIRAVLDALVAEYGLERVGLAGYSMGGNLVLKLAGEYGRQFPQWLVAVAAVSPAADLAACADELHRPVNRIYERHFLRNLMKRYDRKAALYPEIYRSEGMGGMRSVREFDHRITAAYSGFASADDYYDRASAAGVIERIAVPTLVLHALDDPFIRFTAGTRAKLDENCAIQLVETRHGGHCAFLAARGAAVRASLKSAEFSRHWAESTVVGYLAAQAEGFGEARLVAEGRHGG